MSARTAAWRRQPVLPLYWLPETERGSLGESIGVILVVPAHGGAVGCSHSWRIFFSRRTRWCQYGCVRTIPSSRSARAIYVQPCTEDCCRTASPPLLDYYLRGANGKATCSSSNLRLGMKSGGGGTFTPRGPKCMLSIGQCRRQSFCDMYRVGRFVKPSLRDGQTAGRIGPAAKPTFTARGGEARQRRFARAGMF